MEKPHIWCQKCSPCKENLSFQAASPARPSSCPSSSPPPLKFRPHQLFFPWAGSFPFFLLKMSPVQGPFPHPFPPPFGSPVLDCFLRDLPTSLRAFPSSDSQGYVQGNQTYEVHQTSARLSQEGLILEVSRKNNPDGGADKQLCSVWRQGQITSSPSRCTRLFSGSRGFHRSHRGSNCQLNSLGKATPFLLFAHPQTRQLLQPNLPPTNTKNRRWERPLRGVQESLRDDLKTQSGPSAVTIVDLILLKIKTTETKIECTTREWGMASRRKQMSTAMVMASPG